MVCCSWRVRWLGCVLAAGVVAVCVPDSQATAAPQLVLPGQRPSPPFSMTLSARDGWGRPHFAYRADTPTDIEVHFDAAPPGWVSAVVAALPEETRAWLAAVRVDEANHTVHFEGLTRIVRATIDKSGRRRHRTWHIEVRWGPWEPVGAASYVALVPRKDPLRGAWQEAAAAAQEGDCGPLGRLRKRAGKYAPWVRLERADCLWRTGARRKAQREALRLARGVRLPRAVVALAALRLEEWPGGWNPWARVPWPNKTILALPRSIVQELGLRGAVYLLERRRLRRAVLFYLAANGGKRWLPVFEHAAAALRFRLVAALVHDARFATARWLLERVKAGEGNDARLERATRRFAAIAYAHGGDASAAAAEVGELLGANGGVVDPVLGVSLAGAWSRDGQLDAVMQGPPLVPLDAGVWERALPDAATPLGAALAMDLVAWWQALGERVSPVVLRGLVGEAGASDPWGLVAAERLSLGAALGDCEVPAGAVASPGWRAVSSMCALRREPLAALGVWTEPVPSVGAETLDDAVRRHAVEASSFLTRFAPVLAHGVDGS